MLPSQSFIQHTTSFIEIIRVEVPPNEYPHSPFLTLKYFTSLLCSSCKIWNILNIKKDENKKKGYIKGTFVFKIQQKILNIYLADINFKTLYFSDRNFVDEFFILWCDYYWYVWLCIQTFWMQNLAKLANFGNCIIWLTIDIFISLWIQVVWYLHPHLVCLLMKSTLNFVEMLWWLVNNSNWCHSLMYS